MKTIALLAIAGATLLCGCARIPNVKAAEYHRRTTVLGVTSTADLTGVTTRETEKSVTVKAADAKFGLTFPGFDHTQTLKDAEASFKKEEK